MRFHLEQRYVIAASGVLALALSIVLGFAAYEIVGDPLAELSQSEDERAEQEPETEVLGATETAEGKLGVDAETSTVVARPDDDVIRATAAAAALDDADADENGDGDDSSGAGALALVAETAEISGRVWVDINGNGIQDDGEPGAPGVDVTLVFASIDDAADSTTTDGDGNYSFVAVPETYYLFFDIEHSSIAPRNQGTDTTDSDIGVGGFLGAEGGVTDTITIGAGEVDETKDAGIIPVRGDVAIQATTNGNDSDTAPGEELEVGDTVTFTYTVTNTGNVRLINVTVEDDVIGPIGCLEDTLGVGDSLTCVATANVIEGPYVNVGSVSATPIDSIDIELRPVDAQDLSHHVGVAPFVASASVSLDTTTNGEDDSDPGPRLTVGDEVTFTFTATNTGMTDLINVGVSDKVLGEVCVIALLTPGETRSCPSMVSTVTEGAYRSVGFVSATPVDEQGNPFDAPVTASDTSFHTGVIDLSVEKFYPCPTVVDGPVMQRNNGGFVEWDSGLTAAPGSTIEITTSEPGTSPGQPNEQLYVLVGDEQFGPTPGEHTTSSFTVTTGGPVVVVHYSVLNNDSFGSNSVEFSLCGTDLTKTR